LLDHPTLQVSRGSYDRDGQNHLNQTARWLGNEFVDEKKIDEKKNDDDGQN
jgi:hypothetical protein